MEYVLGVDIGTTNTKAIAATLEGTVLCRYEQSNAMITPAPGHYEHDPKALYQTTKTCIAQVAASLKRVDQRAKISAISFSSAMHGVFAMDLDFNPLTNCVLWSDSRSVSVASRLKGTELGNQFYNHTGTPIHAMSPLCKIAWMKENIPSIHARAAKFISIKEYIFFRLFGKFLVDFSIASATGLFDIQTQKWYEPALAYAGITMDQLSNPVPVTHAINGLRAADAEELGIDIDTAFIQGGSDGCLANLGVGAIKKGVAAVTVGTSGAIRVTESAPRVDPEGRVFSYILTPELHIIGGAVNNGGNVLQWFMDSLFTMESENAVERTIGMLIEKAQELEPGADGLVFLPYLLGERAPLWDASAKGVYFGVCMHHRNPHFALATLEGIVYALYEVGTVLAERTGRIDVIHATGGFFESDFCVQLLADVFNTPVHVMEDVDGSALGAVYVALHALGHQWGLDNMPVRGQVVIRYPDPSRHLQYMKAFERYSQLTNLLKNKF